MGNIDSNVIDCDTDPFVPAHSWSVEEHKKGGSFQWDASKVELWLENEQKNGKVLTGSKLCQRLISKMVLNANVLDYLLANPYLIPEEWKDKHVFFWGTVYSSRGGNRFVRFLCWDDEKWSWYYDWLGNGFRGSSPAAVRAH
jgi:hypothetical protein